MPPPTDRLSKLKAVPMIAALDYRHFLDKDGNDQRLTALSRHERRKLKLESKRIGREYIKVIRQFSKSGAGYPVDKLLRELCLEYTHRYASAGLFSQPVNFNYFEPFCRIDFINNTFAPFAEPAFEHDHLFSIIDYLDYTTSSDGAAFELAQLNELPDGQVFHFTTNGDLTDFTYLTRDGREFVVSGFSMIRHGYLLHWYLVGGEVWSEEEWDEQINRDLDLNISDVSPYKRAFLAESVSEDGEKRGAPVALEGTKTAIRTVIAGEINLNSCKHEGRCYMSEREGAFEVICDDPDIFDDISNQTERIDLINAMRERIESAAVLWNLAEAMFQLPSYFAFKVPVQKSILTASGRSIRGKGRGGRAFGVNYRRVSAIEVVEANTPVVKPYTPRHYQVETEGFWRRLVKRESYGRGRDGSPVRGRTWIKSSNKWRERPNGARTIYVKSSVAAAKVAANELVEIAENTTKAKTNVTTEYSGDSEVRGVLYVLRCTAMNDGVYKVGRTSGTAEDRAKSLSAATGVPSSFVVVDFWRHSDPEALETSVHAVLDPYRINEGREFFKADYSKIKRLIEGEIKRIDGRPT